MNMYGWDVVSSLSVAAVNEQLQSNFGKLLSTFHFQDQPAAGTATSVAGTFTSWQVVPGGSGTAVYLALSVGQGSYASTDTGNPQSDKSFQLAGVVVTVELSIDFLPSATVAGQQELRFNFCTNNGQVPSDTSVFCKNVTAPAALGIDSVSQALIGNAITQCLFNNAADVTYVFAALSTTGGNGLPVPTGYSFLYAAPEQTNTSYFSVLSTVLRNSGQAQTAIDSGLFDATSSIFLGLSDGYFLRYVIQPQLPTVFQHGTNSGSFCYNPGSIALNSTGNIDMNEVKSGAIWYQPVITSLAITLNDTTLQTSLSGTCHISPGIDVSFSSTSNSAMRVNGNSISFEPDPNPSISHDTHISKWIIIGVGVIAPIVDAILAAIIAAVSSGIASGLNGAVGAFSMQNLNPNFINWQSFSLSQLTSGGLSSNFFLRGH